MQILESKPYNLCFDTLANELRISILKSLSNGSKSVEEIVKETQAEQSRVSHSLKILKVCNYVEVKKKGKQHIYSLKKGLTASTQVNTNSKKPLHLAFLDYHVENFCHNECKKHELLSVNKKE